MYGHLYSSVGLIRTIEEVQKRFTKKLPGLNVLDYHERLSFLGLESFEHRRLKADLYMTYKILFNHFNLNVDNFFVLRTKKMTRGHPYTLFKLLCKVRTSSEFFACRVVDPWNNLDAKSNSFNVFKKFLNECNLSNFLANLFLVFLYLFIV